jgi:thiopurine S-methyltransferase
MQPDFWHERWTKNEIGFHEARVNPLLVAHLDALALPAGARVFLPLCGKTVDIDWLLSRGYRVAGAELSALAVSQLFERLGLMPVSTRSGKLERLSAAGLDVFVGDIFDLTGPILGAVDGVYDRAALIALPAQMRRSYVMQIQRLAGSAPKLLVTVEYDQRQMEGPPFSVPGDEVRALHDDRKSVLLACHGLPGGLKGKCPATESAWLLA